MEILIQASDGVEIVALTTLDEITTLIGVFEDIAREEGWQPEDQLRSYLQNTIYFALRIEGQTVGGLQLTRSSSTGKLPCHAVWPELPASGPYAAHVVVLALQREVRARDDVFWLLCFQLWRFCWLQHITEVSLEVTPATMRLYERLGWPLRTIGQLRTHWGEDCYLCSMAVDEVALSMIGRAEGSDVQRKRIRRGYDLLRNGKDAPHRTARGIPPSAIPPAVELTSE